MKKSLKKIAVIALGLVMAMSVLAGCGNSSSSSGGNVTLTYSIWDKNQQAGMQAIADAFHKKNWMVVH
ncbi:hypothetical protein [Clostridium sp.]|uniref:hypothetical protein n=1 Tax=Clostridium sp. TaxID=1506 RepID=UPI002587E237|nr:hypothetical protein [Clostridium sp.]